MTHTSKSIDTQVLMAAAKGIVGLVAHMLREEEQRELFNQVMEQLRAAEITRAYLYEQRHRRLNPLKGVN